VYSLGGAADRWSSDHGCRLSLRVLAPALVVDISGGMARDPGLFHRAAHHERNSGTAPSGSVVRCAGRWRSSGCDWNLSFRAGAGCAQDRVARLAVLRQAGKFGTRDRITFVFSGLKKITGELPDREVRSSPVRHSIGVLLLLAGQR